MENLYLKKWNRMDGVGAIVITPTRELAYQIFETLKKVGVYHEFSCGLIIGGKNLKFERTRMDQCNIIICTPGRLLQHMDENPLFNCTSMQILVLDEADRCLDLGFSDTMNAIIENFPSERQTLLFSATQTKSVKDLARLSLKSPVYVAPHEKAEHSTPQSLQQNYVIMNLEDKITMLWSFIKSHLKMKCIVFLSTCKQVKYIYEIFSKLRPGISLLALYGSLHQDRRLKIYDEFCRRSKVILFATDIGSRGLDFPSVNWVIQLDCPEDPNAYIHRAGRTARHKSYGESLLVLCPHEEEGMIEELKANKIPINQIQIDPKRLFSPRVKMEAYIAQSTELKESAQRAFVAYIKSVYLMKNKKVFDVEKINFDDYARSLGLAVTPRVRFLQRIKKRNQQQPILEKSDGASSSEDESVEKVKPTVNLSALMADESDDNDDAGLFKIKRTNHELDENSDESIVDISQKKREKVITKASVAKKIIKKNIKANKKVMFDEDGKEIINTAKQLQSELAKEYQECEDGGIDIEKARELLQQEDKFDKQRFKELIKLKHREQKKKLKKVKKPEQADNDEDEADEFGESDSDDGPDLSWLPDPDKIYGKVEEFDESSDHSLRSKEQEPIHKPPKKLYEKKRGGESLTDEPTKKKSKKDLVSKLNLNDAESLAMSLLNY
jgi:ATP-dependent RNA helicase DDX10/DBP4